MPLPASTTRATNRCHAPPGVQAFLDNLRRATLISLAALAALGWPSASVAESQAGSGAARASVDFRIVIPAIVRIKAIAQPDRLRVTADDVARGYVDLDSGSSVTMTTNSRMGYTLAASFDRRLLTGIEVRAANRSMNSTSGFGSMHISSEYAIDRIVPINYRLYLATGVGAGTYDWPVALQFSLSGA